MSINSSTIFHSWGWMAILGLNIEATISLDKQALNREWDHQEAQKKNITRRIKYTISGARARREYETPVVLHSGFRSAWRRARWPLYLSLSQQWSSTSSLWFFDSRHSRRILRQGFMLSAKAKRLWFSRDSTHISQITYFISEDIWPQKSTPDLSQPSYWTLVSKSTCFLNEEKYA